jgi:hypothetical protein
MMTCQLTKLESALDSLKKSYPDLNAADAALVATALSLAGRHAIAIYDGVDYVWPDQYEALTRAMIAEVNQVNEAVEHNTPKRGAKATAEDEPVQISVGLKPNYTAGENLLKGREDLQTMLSDLLQAGVEFSYNPNDIGWQWALDRANWNTVSGNEISRRIKVKTSFTEGAVGVEMGTTGAKKRKTATAAKADDAE